MTSATAWILTLPAAAALGGLAYGLANLFGSGALGPALISVAAVAALTAGFAGRRSGQTAAPAGA